MADVSGARRATSTGHRTESTLARSDLRVDGDERHAACFAVARLSAEASTVRHQAKHFLSSDMSRPFGEIAALTGGHKVLGGVVEMVAVDVFGDERPLASDRAGSVPVHQSPAVMAGVRSRPNLVVEDQPGLGEQATSGCNRVIGDSHHAARSHRFLSGVRHASSIPYLGGLPFQT